MNFARAWHALCTVDSSVFAFGGADNNLTCEAFNGRAWSSLPNLPHSSNQANAEYFAGNIYLTSSYIDKVMIFNLTSNEFEVSNIFLPTGWCSKVMFCVEDHLYVLTSNKDIRIIDS
jgi:hypothetical protein